jgi:diaminohydroxyphosphoribosylaminopyrimidine deaminase / 5-amino-6-(5-phosphoribosylamino)uracil reductase
MREALRLAERGRNGVSPNPMVGAVVARGGSIVGQGYHHHCGGAHAEVEALREAGRRARGADLYVTLEPCAHQGRTPPCTDAILRAGAARVIFAATDPNPATHGRGPKILRQNGVAVVGGLLAGAAREQNLPYFHWRATGRPWVILKWAMTLDGKIATRTGESRWITGRPARERAHQLRRRADAVLAGTETFRRDDPLLLPRPPRGRIPARVILDRRGRLPWSLKALSPSPPEGGRRIYVVSPRCPPNRRREVQRRGLEVIEAPEAHDRLSLPAVLDALGRMGICQLLVEGGGMLIGDLLSRRLAQEVAVFVAPVLFGGQEAPGPAGGRGIGRLADALELEAPVVRRLGRDVLIQGRIRS